MIERLYWCNECYKAITSEKPVSHCGVKATDIGWVETKVQPDEAIVLGQE